MQKRSKFTPSVFTLFISSIIVWNSLYGDLLIDPTGGTVLFNDSSSHDDQYVTRSLGFTGLFFGDPKTTIDICTNGHANFSGNTGYDVEPLPTTIARIDPFLSDLRIYSGRGGSMIENTLPGTYYSATWQSIQDYSSGLLNFTFQTTWFADNHTINGYTFQKDDIAFSYGSLDAMNIVLGLDKGNGITFSAPLTPDGITSSLYLPTSSNSFILFRPDGSGNYTPYFAAPILQNNTAPGESFVPETGNFIVINNVQTNKGENRVNSLTFANGASLDISNTLYVTSPLSSSATNSPTFNQTGTGTYDGVIEGTGSLTKTGPGMLTILGNHTYTGPTDVQDGTLYVEGSLNSSVTLNNGVFGGDATIGGNLTVNNGELAPGGDTRFGTINIGNDFYILGGGVIDQEIDSLGNTDYINVSGTATLSGALHIEHASGNFIKGQTITILEAAGGINGTFTDVESPSIEGVPLFSVVYNSNSVQLLSNTNLLFLEDPITLDIPKQFSGNSKQVVDYIISQPYISPNSDFGFIVSSLGLVPDDQLNKVLNLLHPGSFGLFGPMNSTTNGEVLNIFNNRMFGMTGGPSSTSQSLAQLTASTDDTPFYLNAPVRRGCESNRTSTPTLWIQPFGSWNSQSQKGELRGVDYKSVGFVVGGDCTFDNWYIGAGGGFTHTHFDWKGHAGDGHMNQFYGGLYGGFFIKYFGVNLATMVGENFYKTSRFIYWTTPNHPGGDVNRTAESKNEGLQWSNHLGLISDFNPFSIPLQLFGNLDHFYLNNSRFSESGADSLNLSVNTKVSNALRSELGISSSYTFQVNNLCWTPYGRISWVNKTSLSSSGFRGAFIGQVGTFSVSATSKGTNQWSPGIGLKCTSRNGLSVLFNTRAELNGKVKNVFGDLNLEYSF